MRSSTHNKKKRKRKGKNKNKNKNKNKKPTQRSSGTNCIVSAAFITFLFGLYYLYASLESPGSSIHHDIMHDDMENQANAEKLEDEDAFVKRMMIEYKNTQSRSSTKPLPSFRKPTTTIPSLTPSPIEVATFTRSRSIPTPSLTSSSTPRSSHSITPTSLTPPINSNHSVTLTTPTTIISTPNPINLLSEEDSTFESATIGQWHGYCGPPVLSHKGLAHTGIRSLLYPAANRLSAIWCAPYLKFPSKMKVYKKFLIF